MKNRDLLNMLGDIDDGMIEDAAPDFSIKRRKKRPQNHYMKLIAIAACCTLILCGAMVAAPVINKIVYPNVATTETGAGEVTESPTSTPSGSPTDVPVDEPTGAPTEEPTDEPNVENTHAPTDDPMEEPTEQSTSIHEEPTGATTEGGTRIPTGEPMEAPTESPTDEIVEEPYFGYNSFTDDERFINWNITDSYCPSDLVGKNIATITINRQYEYYNSDMIYELEAEVNEVIGADGEGYLCYRIVKVDERLDLYVDCESYCFLTEKNYKFVSLFDFRDKYFIAQGISYGYMRYYQRIDEEYCKDFVVEGELLEKLLSKMFETDYPASNGISDEEINAESAENVSFTYTSLYSGKASIYDNGYLVFYTPEFDTQIFNIGKEKARELIYIVIREGTPQGYIWNEMQEKWHKIEFDSLAHYPTFNEVLEENKLMGQIEFQEEIDYWETKFHGWSPDILLLDRESRISVTEIMYRADGDAVIVEDITKLANEGMTFVCVNNLTGNACFITVYNSGHIRFDKYYYFVGTECTNAIIGMVCTSCTTYYVNASCFGWNEKKECWDTYDPKAEEIRTENSYGGEYDYEWPTWVPDDEQSADVPNEYETETPTDEPYETETELFEDEYEITE